MDPQSTRYSLDLHPSMEGEVVDMEACPKEWFGPTSVHCTDGFRARKGRISEKTEYGFYKKSYFLVTHISYWVWAHEEEEPLRSEGGLIQLAVPIRRYYADWIPKGWR